VSNIVPFAPHVIDVPLALRQAQAEFRSMAERGAGGLRAHRRLADGVDGILRSIAAQLLPVENPSVALVAIGGYGSRAQCLHSDVDLLLVFAGHIGKAEERIVNGVLLPLWDLKLAVGHHVRTLEDFGAVEMDNPEYVLAIQTARFVAGDIAVFDKMRALIAEGDETGRGCVLELLLQLTDERHARFNRTVFQLEPDIKDAPGGLRDIAAARMALSLAEWQMSAEGVELDRLDRAENELLRIRAILHSEQGRNLNVLTHELQETVADRLRYRGAESHQQVEVLMGAYFRHARRTARALARARSLVGAAGLDDTRVVLEANIDLGADGVRFVDAKLAAAEPASWLSVFSWALEHGTKVSYEALDVFECNAVRYAPADLMPTEADRRRLMFLLRPRAGLYARLSEMHDCGVLTALFPEFKAISGLVIRDFFHKYTVDEHTLLTIRGLERLVESPPGRERIASLLAELRAPELLVLALLYHDVGKWKDDKHDEESVRMALPMLERLGLSAEERQDVMFLIGQHLQMSKVAFRQDTADPAVVQLFSTLVGTEERLKLLTLMTTVDVEAVSADTLTPWKEELMWRLYMDAYSQITLGYGDDVIDGPDVVEVLQSTRPDDIVADELTRMLSGFPRRYLVMCDAERVYQHVRLARDMRPDEVHLFLEPKREAWELTVVALDSPGLFANICGVLSYYGMDILRVSAMTSQADLVVDIFQFADNEGFFRLNPGATGQVKDTLRAVVAGREDLSALLRRKARSVLRRLAPSRVPLVVALDNVHSQRYTVLEIVVEDSLGLGYRISQVLSQHRCDVDLVLLSTEGKKAIDVFHLTKAGSKLTDVTQMALKLDLERMLEENYETD
jgi:[protein-PII] uridylyltransferase